MTALEWGVLVVLVLVGWAAIEWELSWWERGVAQDLGVEPMRCGPFGCRICRKAGEQTPDRREA